MAGQLTFYQVVSFIGGLEVDVVHVDSSLFEDHSVPLKLVSPKDKSVLQVDGEAGTKEVKYNEIYQGGVG